MIDMNEIIKAGRHVARVPNVAETFAQDSLSEQEKKHPSTSGIPSDCNQTKAEIAVENRHSDIPTVNRQTIINTQESQMENNNLQQTSQHTFSSKHSEIDQPPVPKAQCQPQSIPICSKTNSPHTHHERLVEEACQGAEHDHSGAARRHRTPDHRSSPNRDHVVRKDTCGSNVRRSLEQQPRVDTVVSAALPEELQVGTPKDDPVHQTQGRNHGREHRGIPTDASHAQESCNPKDNAYATQGKGMSQQCDVLRGERATPRGAMDSNGGIGLAEPRGAYGHDGKRTPADSSAPGADSHCQHGPSRGLPDDADRRGVERSLESVKPDLKECDLALAAGEIDDFTTSELNRERSHFWKLVSMIEHELEKVQSQSQSKGRIHLLEVFCSADSNLTHQVNMLGGKAIRFGLNQGDLHTTEGRARFFELLCSHCPEHVWVSPVCKPWSQWSHFNSQRSLDAWDKINHDRRDMLVQVALCFVLCRHQIRHERHVHWEQPKGSVMMKLPYIQEIYQYMRQARPDLCQAGDFRDPENNLHIKKGLNITTSSPSMFEELDPLKCNGSHLHQIIEGSTHAHGQTIVARSAFSEVYPRRFARRVAKVMLKKMFPREKPFGSLTCPALALFDAVCALSDRPAKRMRRDSSGSNKTKSADRESRQSQDNKRIKTETKNLEEDSQVQSDEQKAIELIMNKVEPLLPRVGKKELDQPQLMQMFQYLFPNKEVKSIIACKGTERTMGPLNP